jgi:hypothetical protein
VKIRNARLRFGHAPGHVRETFCDAIEAFVHWNDGEPEPVVEFEVNYEPVEIPISRACTLVWNCRDIVPGFYADWASEAGLEFKTRTYAGIAHAMLQAIREQTQTAA